MEFAPPRDYDPAILLPVDGEPPEMTALKEFVFLLGLAFNDIKALCWVDAQLRKGAPPTGESARLDADPYKGNWTGMLKTFDRLSSGIITETYRLIRTYAHKGVFKTEVFERAFRKLERRYRVAWEALLRDAEHAEADRLRKYHRDLRNAVGYHYNTGGKVIIEGYRKHVAAKPGHPAFDKAWVSLGKNMETSRFYFADAAAVQVQERIGLECGGVTPDERQTNVRNINVAVRMLLEQLLEQLRGLNKPPPAQAAPPR
jgi:hypothetical protein